LQITDLQAEPTRGPGVRLMFTLTQAAETTVMVRSLSGRETGVVEVQRSRSAGVNTVAWDGRDAQGRPLPPGVYLVEVQVWDEEGQQVRAVKAVTLR
jgi:flagellar hook assembly protein FlgD